MDGAREIPFETLNTLAVRALSFFQTFPSSDVSGIERDVYAREQLLPEERFPVRSPTRSYEERIQETIRAQCGARERTRTLLRIRLLPSPQVAHRA